MRPTTLLKLAGSVFLILWAMAVPTWSFHSLQGGAQDMPLFFSISMGTNKPFQPITITVTQTKDKSYLAYGRTPGFFFQLHCTTAQAPMHIDPDKESSVLYILGSADVLFREGPRLISDNDIRLVLIMISTPPLFSSIPKPSGFCQLYLERRSENQ